MHDNYHYSFQYVFLSLTATLYQWTFISALFCVLHSNTKYANFDQTHHLLSLILHFKHLTLELRGAACFLLVLFVLLCFMSSLCIYLLYCTQVSLAKIFISLRLCDYTKVTIKVETISQVIGYLHIQLIQITYLVGQNREHSDHSE